MKKIFNHNKEPFYFVLSLGVHQKSFLYTIEKEIPFILYNNLNHKMNSISLLGDNIALNSLFGKL